MILAFRRPIHPTVYAVLSSLLYMVSFPPFHTTGFAWVALLPLLFAVQHLNVKRPFLLGWLSGTLAYSGILYWLVVTIQTAHLSMVLATGCLGLLSAYLGLYWGVWLWWMARTPSTLVGALSGAAVWVGLEYLRTYLFSGFSWALFADSQYQNLPLIQCASLTGAYGVSFLMVFMNIGWTLHRRTMLTALALIVVTLAFGVIRLQNPSLPTRAKSYSVALLQGSIDQYKKWDEAYVDDIEKTYAALARDAAKDHPFLIVWPETSVPGYLLQDPPLWKWLSDVIRETSTNHLIGAPVIQGGVYNAAFAINPSGEVTGEYAKKHLVPFGEIVPWASVLGRYIHVLNELGGFAAGDRSSVVTIGGVPCGINICYEAIFPDLVRRSVAHGAQLIINITNDGWYMKTAEPYQHLAPNIFRAVENDRWLLRADNTGISAIIDPRGRQRAVSPLFQPWIVKGTVTPQTQRTLYTTVGDLFAWICVLFWLLCAIRSVSKTRSQFLIRDHHSDFDTPNQRSDV